MLDDNSTSEVSTRLANSSSPSSIIATKINEATDNNSHSETYELSMRWRMRWFVLIIIAIGFLGSIAASIAFIIIAKTFLTLIVPPSLTLIFRPIVHWLFPSEQHNKILGNSSMLTTLLSAIGTYVGAKEVAKKVAREKKDTEALAHSPTHQS